MPLFSANLNFLFNEVPFLDRFRAAAEAGFKYVEFMFPYDYDLEAVQNQLKGNGLKLVLFNLPAGNWAEGDRGIAADPARKEEYLAGVSKAVEAAKVLEVSRVNCLVGKIPGNYTQSQIIDNLVANIRYTAEEFAKAGLDLMVEPINHYDIPGFFLNKTDQVMDIIAKVNKTNVYLQYDMYHAEREEENHDVIIEKYLSRIGHIQIADNPGRNQPGTGVMNYEYLINKLEKLGYQGYIGLEYKPTASTVESLTWVKEYGYKL